MAELVDEVGQESMGEPVSTEEPVSPPPSEQPTATETQTPAELSPDIQAEIERRVQAEARRLQSVKDREVAAERKRFAQEAKANREALRAQMVQAGQDPAQVDQYLEQQAKLAFADEMLERQQAEQQALQRAAEHIRAAGLHKYGVTPDDSRLLGLQSWEAYDDRLDEIRRAEETKAQQAAQKQQAAAQRQAADQRLGAAAALTPGQTGNVPAAQEKAQLWTEYNALLDAGAPPAKRKPVEDRLRALGETI